LRHETILFHSPEHHELTAVTLSHAVKVAAALGPPAAALDRAACIASERPRMAPTALKTIACPRSGSNLSTDGMPTLGGGVVNGT
jgi:hypothetical protein